MKKFLIYSIFIFIGLSAIAQPTPPTDKAWVSISELTDEFNTTSLDNAKWLNYHPYWTGRAPSYFDSNNISVANGNLRLKSTVANYNQTGNWIKACCVASKTKAMKVGYYSEARIKCPKMSMTGAYWFQGSFSEIDVIENFGAPTAANYAGHDRHMKTNTHYFKNGWANDVVTPWSGNILPTSCADDYYTYGVWWKDTRTIVYYLNGTAVRTTTLNNDFNEDMYMFFDMEAFDWGIGFPTIASLDDATKNTQYVDWVRTYMLVNNSPITNIISNPGFELATIAPWTSWGTVTQSSSVFNTGSKSVYVNGSGAAEQVVNLMPNTNYSFSGWGKVGAAGQQVNLGVKEFGGADVAVQFTTTTFEKKSINFTTGASNITAKIYFYSPGNNQAYGDDFELKTFTTSINQLSDKKRIAYISNPIKAEEFNIQIDNNGEPIEISIFDLNGHLLYVQKTNSQQLKLSKNIFKGAGLYFLKGQENSNFEFHKLIVL